MLLDGGCACDCALCGVDRAAVGSLCWSRKDTREEKKEKDRVELVKGVFFYLEKKK